MSFSGKNRKPLLGRKQISLEMNYEVAPPENLSKSPVLYPGFILKFMNTNTIIQIHMTLNLIDLNMTLLKNLNIN